MSETGRVTFPDMPHIPDLPSHRPAHMTVSAILGQARGALEAAREWLQELENCRSSRHQFAAMRLVVIEMRRSTFVLQKLSSRVDGWEEFWRPLQEAMRGDELLRYFHDLRTQIEKQGLPAALAELVEVETGVVLADVSCGEDEYGVWVSGSMRQGPAAPEIGNLDPERIALCNFRLADPPRNHCDEQLSDLRFAVLAALAIGYLDANVLRPASERFGPA